MLLGYQVCKVGHFRREMEVLHQENWTAEVTDQLRRFEKTLIIAMKEKGWDGKEDEASIRWTFSGSLFYSITVITTIGEAEEIRRRSY